MTVRITARLFAMQRQQTGRKEVPLELPDGATVADAWRALVAAWPDFEAATSVVRFARNGTYADPDEELAEGDQVAVIPPVAGGGPEEDDPVRVEVAITGEPVDDATVSRLRRAIQTPGDGAVVTFLGRTRITPGTPAPGQEQEAARVEGQQVVALEYEAFEEMARSVLHAIAGEVGDRFGVRRLAVVHRTGEVPVGEASVAICVAAPHRGAAFDACRYVIDELKARAPIWKSERFADGSVWLGAPARRVPLEDPEEVA